MGRFERHVFICTNKAGCLDQCEKGVSVVVYPEGVWYGHVTPADCDEILEKHLMIASQMLEEAQPV